MNNEVYFGEVDCRRFDRLEQLMTDMIILLERIANKLEEPEPQ
jgi:hypothetical protein